MSYIQPLTNEVFGNEMRRLGKQVELLTKVIAVAHASKVSPHEHPQRELMKILEEALRQRSSE